MDHKIAKEMFNLSQCLPSNGSFHKILSNGDTEIISLKYDIPVCCKIVLDGQEPPLQIKINGVKLEGNLKVFASHKVIVPSKENCDMRWIEFSNSLVIRGEQTHKRGIEKFEHS